MILSILVLTFVLGYGLGAYVEERAWVAKLTRRGYSSTAIERIAREAWRA